MRSLLLTLPLLGACWPYIPGSWVDNAPARAAGSVSWVEYEGPGWADNTPTGGAVWGWFQLPQDDFSTNWVLAAPTGCTDKSVDLADYTSGLVDLQGATSVLSSSNGDVPLTWASDTRLYYAPLVEGDMDSQAATWSLEETALQEGSIEVSPFVTVPGQIPYYGPDPGDSEDANLQELALSQLAVTWSGETADVVAVAGALLNSQGEVLEQWTCAAPVEDGQVSIPEDRWDEDNVDSAVYLLFGVSHLVITSTAIEGMEPVSRGVGTRTRLAFYTLDKP